MIHFKTGDLVGQTFLLDDGTNGLRCHPHIIEVLGDHQKKVSDTPLLKNTELNGLEAWATSISNMYLEAETWEKVLIIAGSKFGELGGHHTLIIFKALCRLQSSALRWSEKFLLLGL